MRLERLRIPNVRQKHEPVSGNVSWTIYSQQLGSTLHKLASGFWEWAAAGYGSPEPDWERNGLPGKASKRPERTQRSLCIITTVGWIYRLHFQLLFRGINMVD